MAWTAEQAGQSSDARAEAEQALNWRQQEVLETYRRHHAANRHKMVPIPVCVIPDDIRFIQG